MKTEQKELVRSTFAQIQPIAEQAAALFYNRLFVLAPEVKPLFKYNMDEQGRKLMQMIAIAVAHLDRIEELIPSVQALGKRHTHYGVHAAHYASVGTALLWTLEQGLGSGWTPEAAASWKEVYGLLSSIMRNAQQAARAKAAA